MIRRSSLLMVAVLAALVPQGAVRADDPAARREIEAAYARISASFKRQDAAGMMAFATGDFKVRTPGGRVLNRQQAQDNVQLNLDTIRSVTENRYTLGKLTWKGNDAIVPVTERFAVTYKDTRGEFGAVGKLHKVAGTTTYRDVWTKQGGTWKLRLSEMRAIRLTIDGRPYRPRRTRPQQR